MPENTKENSVNLIGVSEAEATAAIAGMAQSPTKHPQNDDGEEDVDWNDIEKAKEGDNMYGDQLDSGWLSGLRGVKLLREAERLVNTSLMRRDGIERECLWREVFASLEINYDDLKNDAIEGKNQENQYNPNDLMDIDVPDKEMEYTSFMITIHKIKTLFKDITGKPMGGNTLSAICLRFGPSMITLNESLIEAAECETRQDRYMRKKEAYEAFNGRSIIPTLSQEALVDAKEIIRYFMEQELLFEIIETQVSRAGAVLEVYQGSGAFATTENLTEICRALGLPALGGKVVLPICASAMIFAGLQPDMPCPIEILGA